MISPSLPGSRVYLPPSPERHRFAGVTLQLLDDAGMRWAQGLVTVLHYLHAPVDARCSVEGYSVQLYRRPMGALLFGRPEATRCGDWYGSVADVQSGRCEVTRWQVLNLARVFLLPLVQAGGALFGPQHLPGFVTAKAFGVAPWRVRRSRRRWSALSSITSWPARRASWKNRGNYAGACLTATPGFTGARSTRPLVSSFTAPTGGASRPGARCCDR
jgi:hypothetical protein